MEAFDWDQRFKQVLTKCLADKQVNKEVWKGKPVALENETDKLKVSPVGDNLVHGCVCDRFRVKIFCC